MFTDAGGRVVASNQRAQEVLLLGGDELARLTSETLQSGKPQREVTMAVRPRRGAERWLVANSQPVMTGVPPRLAGAVTTFTDITAQRAAETDVKRLLALLRREALTDALTGLANRRAFDERLGAELSRARRHGEPVSLALLDLDGFKALNDRHGHPEGDRALARLAEILGSSVRAEDTAARLAGDEFAVILPSTSAADAQPVIGRIAGAVAGDPILAVLGSTVSAGVAEARDEDAGALYSAADAALYASKRAGGARVTLADQRAH